MKNIAASGRKQIFKCPRCGSWIDNTPCALGRKRSGECLGNRRRIGWTAFEDVPAVSLRIRLSLRIVGEAC